MNRTWYAITYDVRDDRRRDRIAQLLLDHGERVQKSVYECHLGPDQRDRLWSRLIDAMDPETDSMRMYSVCASCWTRGRVAGCGEISEVQGLVIV